MIKYLICILLIWSCSNSPSVKNGINSLADTLINKGSKHPADTIFVRKIFNTADSVILASHYSPNEPRKDEKTGKYLPHFEVIENGKLNQSIVQERKRLDGKEIKELGDILLSTAVADSIATMCFQPRNGIFVYNSGKLSYIDVCFDCHGFTISRNWAAHIIFDNTKYERLLLFYKKHGFQYML